MRVPLIIANWKMNHTVSDSIKFVTRLNRELKLTQNTDIVICPPFTSLNSLHVAIAETPELGIKLGAQNCHFETSGAFTGEISPAFLKEMGCDYVILGHSERRHLFKESSAEVGKKVLAALNHDLRVVLCVGETLAERESSKTWDVILSQLQEGLKNVPREKMSHVTIAYEPVWAIGTGKNADPPQAQETHQQIRSWILEQFDIKIAQELRILYGGSVKPDNISSFMKMGDVDGALVGGASLEVESFIKIIHFGR